MIGRGKKAVVAHPERDPAFAKLKAEQELLHTKIESCSRTWARGRARLDELSCAPTAGEPVDRNAMREVAEQVDEAERDRAEARRRLREIAGELPLARQRAARVIAAEHRDRFNGLAADFLKARLQRLAPEIVAATKLRRLRDELTARRVAKDGMTMPSTAARADVGHAQLREDIEGALSVGALEPGDIPAALRGCWGLK